MDRYQPLPDDQGDVPTLPSSRTPTPPYSPGRKTPISPIQRFNELQMSSVSGTPDGRPAALPAGRYLQGAVGPVGIGALSRVRQRFSGSGLLPLTKSQRTERRAQVTTLSLAGAAALLIVASALLLFQPTIQWPGFGQALGQQFSRLASNIPLFIQGTPPPAPRVNTPTPSPNSGAPVPTSTPRGGPGPAATPVPTATSVPTATPVPTLTPAPTATPLPTSIPTVLPSLATVTFTSVPAQNLASNGTMRACPSGCDLPTQSTSGSAQGQYFKQYVSGWQSTQVNGSLSVTATDLRICFVQPHYCDYPTPAFPLTFPGSTITFYNNSITWSCNMYVSSFTEYGQGNVWLGNLGNCTDNTQANSLPPGYFSGSGSWTQPYGTDGTFEAYFSFSSNTMYADCAGCGPGYYYPTPGDCNIATGNAYSAAFTNAQNAINSWGSGKLNVTHSITQGSSSCSPAPYHQGGSVTGYATDSYSASGFAIADAQSVASARIKALLPGGYYWSSGPTTCSPTAGSWNGSEIDNIQCSDSGTASYDWRSGSAAQANLKGQLAGQSNANALAICNSFPGVQPGTCSITYSGGNVQTVPSSPGQIQINAQ